MSLQPHEPIQPSEDALTEQLHSLLQAGLEKFKMELGIISHIEDNTYTIQYFQPSDSGLTVGQVFDFSKTYCHITVNFRQTIGIHHMHESEHRAHPCYGFFNLESYIGTPIHLNDDIYGTLNFSSAAPHPVKFTQADRNWMKAKGEEVSALLAQIKSS